MQAALVNTPRTPEEWALWGFAHRDHHFLIQQAIQAQAGVNLPVYLLDPIPYEDSTSLDNWLASNQAAHNDMNNVLGLSGSSLDKVNLANPEETDAWIFLHRKEHEAAASVLAI